MTLNWIREILKCQGWGVGSYGCSRGSSSTVSLKETFWNILSSCNNPTVDLSSIIPHYPFDWAHEGPESAPAGWTGTNCSALASRHVLDITLFISTSHLSISLSLIGWAVFSIVAKIITRAEWHRGTPHPIELTSPGWFSFQLPSAQTGVPCRWAECELLSTQHTVRGRAWMTTVYN